VVSEPSPQTPTASQRHRAREAVVQALYQWELSGYPLSQVEAMFRADHDLKRADLQFFHHALSSIDQTHDTLVDALTPF
jgi:Transcription termination factor